MHQTRELFFAPLYILKLYANVFFQNNVSKFEAMGTKFSMHYQNVNAWVLCSKIFASSGCYLKKYPFFTNFDFFKCPIFICNYNLSLQNMKILDPKI